MTVSNVRAEILRYSQLHPTVFCSADNDGCHRIPMKKLMKAFEIKKKSPMEKQNTFRAIVNDICDLELVEDIGKVLVLKENNNNHVINPASEDNNSHSCSYSDDYGYQDAAPSSCREESRFQPPPSSSSGLSVATADSVGVYDNSASNVRKQGYKRRGSVTRYSIVAQDAVVEEYKQHEDVINRFRRDSLKIENGMKHLSVADNKSHNTLGTAATSSDPDIECFGQESSVCGKNSESGSKRSIGNRRSNNNNNNNSKQQQQGEQATAVGEGGAVKRFFRRGRFSLTF